ncbi:hypothetical protein P691DRAFT_644473, partial [Macrolepiota fuliginosa MF-IS2]
VMGPTGARKSTFIKVATGIENIQISDTLTSCTQKLHAVQLHSEPWVYVIIFLNTPGFNDIYKTDTQIPEQTADRLWETFTEYKAGVKLSSILYFYCITDNHIMKTCMVV